MGDTMMQNESTPLDPSRDTDPRTLVRGFVTENFLFGEDDDRLTNSASFLETGIIDSTGILELIGFIEREFGITVADDELLPENLDSLDNIYAYIRRKTGDR